MPRPQAKGSSYAANQQASEFLHLKIATATNPSYRRQRNALKPQRWLTTTGMQRCQATSIVLPALDGHGPLSIRVPAARALLRVVRVLICLLAVAFLITEGKEYLELRQITHVAVFTTVFLANYKLQCGAVHQGPAVAARAKVASMAMFLASMFAIGESSMDQLIA